jgi:hypothetical protein
MDVSSCLTDLLREAVISGQQSVLIIIGKGSAPKVPSNFWGFGGYFSSIFVLKSMILRLKSKKHRDLGALSPLDINEKSKKSKSHFTNIDPKSP